MMLYIIFEVYFNENSKDNIKDNTKNHDKYITRIISEIILAMTSELSLIRLSIMLSLITPQKMSKYIIKVVIKNSDKDIINEDSKNNIIEDIKDYGKDSAK